MKTTATTASRAADPIRALCLKTWYYNVALALLACMVLLLLVLVLLVLLVLNMQASPGKKQNDGHQLQIDQR